MTTPHPSTSPAAPADAPTGADAAAAPELDAERAFLACVLSAPHTAAARLLAGMRADDFAHPLAQLVAQLAIELTADGHTPAPAAILAHAETTGRVPGLRDLAADKPRRDGGEQRYHHLALWVLDTYTQDAWPGLGHYLKGAVIEHAWRRAITEHATRLAQAATRSPADVLAALLDDTDRITELQRRRHRARTTDHREPAAPPTAIRKEAA